MDRGVIAETGADAIGRHWPAAALAPAALPGKRQLGQKCSGLWKLGPSLAPGVPASQQTQRAGLGKAGAGQGRRLLWSRGKGPQGGGGDQGGNQASTPRTF